jgi:hypothetical protein
MSYFQSGRWILRSEVQNTLCACGDILINFLSPSQEVNNKKKAWQNQKCGAQCDGEDIAYGFISVTDSA